MAKPKTNKQIHQPDDRFFKEVMSTDGSAGQYLMTHHPSFAKSLDLSTLELIPTKLTISSLKVFDADVVYRCQFKGSKEQLTISFLWENKSAPSEHTYIQVGLYLFLMYHKMVTKEKRKLEPIVPIIFYNGKETWCPKSMRELLNDHIFLDLIEGHLPKFDFLFTNITTVPREKLLRIDMSFFKSAMIAMANRHNMDLLFKEFSVIFDLNDEDQLVAVGHYVFGIFERLPERIKSDLQQFDVKIKSNIMSTLALLHKEGELVGLAKGRVEGRVEGKVEGRVEGRVEGIELTLKVIELNSQGISPEEISKILKEDLHSVNEIIGKL